MKKKQINIRVLFLILTFFTIGISHTFAQPSNDECRFARSIPSADNYCSANSEFTNVGATPDPEFTDASNTCISIRWQNGVWFSFVPREPAVLIRIFGFGEGGTMRSPKILLFERCNSFVKCSPGKDVGVDELVVDNLNIGQTYFIMVESAVGGEGSFRLCIDDFVPVPSPESDCKDAVILCDKSSFVVNSLIGIGTDRNEIENGNCIGEEFASSWYKWTCDQPGTLTFTLTPNNFQSRNQITDDLDFALYELPNGLDDCNNKRLVRCMASGANGDGLGNTAPLAQWINCNGPTGLREGETDNREEPGCQPGNTNFLAPLVMEEGKSYVLIVNNFSRSGLGFSIEFGGSGTFLGPEVDFEITAEQKFECDKSILFTNKSESTTDPIISYLWNFGDRSVPNRQTGFGPYNILYESFGDKIAALTVESSRGCRVTKILEFFVEPCCKDTSTLDLSANVIDLRCHEIPEGSVFAIGRAGSPEYSFSLNGSSSQPSPNFSNLAAGPYNLEVTDIKGCQNSIDIIVNQPPPIEVDAGEDQLIDFGDSTILSATYFSFNGPDSLIWTDENGVVGIGNPLPVFPVRTTTYTLTVIDRNGCTRQDIVTLRINKVYNLFTPNIITPLLPSNNNHFFNVWGNNTIKAVELLEVYDRWGNKVYEGVDSRLSEAGPRAFNFAQAGSGWNGKFKDEYVVNGVFTWLARVLYIDDEVKVFTGNVTVVR
ncbi:MAG: hypothetical protein IPM42_08415 [Saprospiraceae bacterium]|nr:hypothetical protein [Saprospiraceae bacterium]